MPASKVRSRFFDFGAGLIALTVFVVAILLQSVSQVAMEYGAIVLPIIAFPLATWMRIRAGSSPWFAFFAVNVWLVRHVGVQRAVHDTEVRRVFRRWPPLAGRIGRYSNRGSRSRVTWWRHSLKKA